MQQSRNQTRHRSLIGLLFIGKCPLPANGPFAAQHLRMGQWLVEALVPSARTNVEPELNGHGSVHHQERVSGRDQNRFFVFCFPRFQILRGDNSLLKHGDIFASEIEIGMIEINERRLHRQTEFPNQFDQTGGDARRVEVAMESKPGL